MRKKTFAALAAAALTIGALAGCSSQNTGDKKESAGTENASKGSTEKSTEAEEKALTDADIVIAGGDPAGMAAAIQAVAEGTDPSKILVIGKGESLSGDSMNAVDTAEQAEAGIEDTVESYIADTMKAGGEKNNQEMAEYLGESGREALDWVKELGVEFEGTVTQAEGSSTARSYQAAAGKNLGEEIQKKLEEKYSSLKVNVAEDASLAQVLYGSDGEVTGVKIKSADGEQEITCRSLVVTDLESIDLLKDLAVTYVTDEEGKNTGIVVDSCASAITSDGGEIPGLYGAGEVIDAALHGDKALAGNELTGVILFGTTAGTESSIYAQENVPEK